MIWHGLISKFSCPTLYFMGKVYETISINLKELILGSPDQVLEN